MHFRYIYFFHLGFNNRFQEKFKKLGGTMGKQGQLQHFDILINYSFELTLTLQGKSQI